MTTDAGMAICYFSQDVGEMSGISATAAVVGGIVPVSALGRRDCPLKAAMGGSA